MYEPRATFTTAPLNLNIDVAFRPACPRMSSQVAAIFRFISL